jgi:hypothetical protein
MYRAKVIGVDGSDRGFQTDNKLTLEELQELVGGYIQVVNCWNGVEMIVNEDGLSLGLPINAKASKIYGHGTVVGAVVLLAYEMD